MVKPGGRKMAAYKTKNISRQKKRAMSRNFGKKGKGSSVHKKSAKPSSLPHHMGKGPKGSPTGGGGKSMAGGMFGSQQRTGKGAPLPGAGPMRGGSRRVSV